MLGKSAPLKAFLTAKPAEFRILSRGPREGVWARVTASLQHGLGVLGGPRARDPEFEKEKTYLTTLYDHLGSMERNAVRIHHERRGLVREGEVVPAALRHLAPVAGQLQGAMRAVAAAAEGEGGGSHLPSGARRDVSIPRCCGPTPWF